MSQAIAGLSAYELSGAAQSATPMVLIDGAPEPDLHVTRFVSDREGDTRSACVEGLSSGIEPEFSLTGRTLTLALPHRLADNSVRWRVLLSGTQVSPEAERSAGVESPGIVVRDQLAVMLEEPAEALGDWPETGLSLATLIDRLAGLLQAGVVHACRGRLLETVIQPPALLSQTIGDVLLDGLAQAGLAICQSLRLEHDQVRRTLTVMPEHSGRTIDLPWPDALGRGGAVQRVNTGADQRAPRSWIALGDRPVVEDTFELQQGWDPALEGQADAQYGRLTSTDFSRFGAVYRAWVLNEDGAYSASPFDLGPAFDVAGLFDRPGKAHQAIAFGDCLARDASGRRIGPVIESSTDSGSSWNAYPGQARVMTDRGGVLLLDDTLPASILSAAKAGTLRIRVTASLTATEPISAQRWDGNPFAGAGPTRRVRFGDRYAWRRVAPTSIHATSIDAGHLSADTVDDRLALAAALRDQIARQPKGQVRATIDLAGAWTALCAGDRVWSVIEPGVGIDRVPCVFAGRRARIRRLHIDFGVGRRPPQTRLYLD